MKTVFIIEPDTMLALGYKDSIEALGVQVQIFKTAAQAVRALEQVVPDVIVLELALPVHNGFELLYELHSYSDTRNTAVVVNSFVQEADVPFGFISRGHLGIVDYLYKPLTPPKRLAASVRRALAGVPEAV